MRDNNKKKERVKSSEKRKVKLKKHISTSSVVCEKHSIILMEKKVTTWRKEEF
jgi:hypothetical protein